MSLANTYPSLKDKVVLITGGATGIGANLVSAFCTQGAKVAFVDIQESQAKLLVNALSAKEGTHSPYYIPCDLKDITHLRQVIDQVRKALGPITVLINNAANDERHTIDSVDLKFWDDAINVNLRHYFFSAQAVVADMKAQGGGSIINMGSICWHRAVGGMSVYSTAKAAIEGLTREQARELGPFGIRVNTLLPGWVMTPRQLQTCVDEMAEKEIEASQCLKSQLTSEDISAMALFLSSDDSKMCTAQRFIVDGGWI